MEDKPKRKRGRPALEEGVEMTDVTLRVRKKVLDHVDEVILPMADNWPEFVSQNPTRAAVLKLAIAIGLNTLQKRK